MVARLALVVIGAALWLSAGDPASAQQQPIGTPGVPQIESLKEKLSDKASDQQRVNDCNVPPEKRGSSTRPTTCATDAPAAAPGTAPGPTGASK